MTRETRQAILDNEFAQDLAVINKQWGDLCFLVVSRIELECKAAREDKREMLYNV